MASAHSLPSPGPAEMGGDDSISGERRRDFSSGDRRPSKRKLVEEDGGASEVAALRAELEEERAAAATGASEAMAMILRLQREKGLLLMEMRQFRRVAEEKMAYQEQQLRALSGDLRACRHRLLLLRHGDAADLSGDEEEEDDERDEEIAEIGSLGRRVEALEAEIRKISGRLGEEETEKPSSSSSYSPFNPEKTTAITRRNPPHQPWPIKFKRLIAEFVPHWILSLVCSRMIGGAAVGLLFLLFSIGFSRRIRLRRRLSHTTASKIRGDKYEILLNPRVLSSAAAAPLPFCDCDGMPIQAFKSVLSPRLLCSAIRFKRKKKMKKTTTTKTKTKKPRFTQGIDEEDGLEEGSGFALKSSASYRSHPIQPLGNLLLVGGGDPSSNIRDRGLGSLCALSDELLLDILSLLAAADLARLAAVSRSLYVFSTHDPLWRNLVLQDYGGDFLFSGSWRSTHLSSRSGTSSTDPGRSIRIRDFYSDYLFQSWLCANLEMKREWLSRDNIERRRGISVAEFVSCFEEPNRPVLLEGCIDGWPAMSKWEPEGLARICEGVKLAVGPVEMSVENFFRYADAAKEERPLYLFDPKFADKVPELGRDYSVPEYFAEDLFSVLGDERPDYRWIIAGAAGSGSSFHVDPNSTSAWNAVIRGAKKWVMFPPEVVPPGVHPSADGAEVACPVSIAEWFMNFYGSCRVWKRRPVECVCRAGEIVFVPNGWWHLVVNLEDSIAITQNYVSRRNLLNVLEFLRRPNAKELVSGTEDRVNLYDKFRRAVESSSPGLIEQLRSEAEEKMSAKQKKMTFWDAVSDANTGGFKFSF